MPLYTIPRRKGVLPRGGLDASEGTEFPAVNKDASRYRTSAIPHRSPRTGFPGSESNITKLLLIWLPVWLFNGREHAFEPSLFIQLAHLRVLFFEPGKLIEFMVRDSVACECLNVEVIHITKNINALFLSLQDLLKWQI